MQTQFCQFCVEIFSGPVDVHEATPAHLVEVMQWEKEMWTAPNTFKRGFQTQWLRARRRPVVPGITLWEILHHNQKTELMPLAVKLNMPRKLQHAKEVNFKKALWELVNKDATDLEALRGRPEGKPCTPEPEEEEEESESSSSVVEDDHVCQGCARPPPGTQHMACPECHDLYCFECLIAWFSSGSPRVCPSEACGKPWPPQLIQKLPMRQDTYVCPVCPPDHPKQPYSMGHAAEHLQRHLDKDPTCVPDSFFTDDKAVRRCSECHKVWLAKGKCPSTHSKCLECRRGGGVAQAVVKKEDDAAAHAVVVGKLKRPKEEGGEAEPSCPACNNTGGNRICSACRVRYHMDCTRHMPVKDGRFTCASCRLPSPGGDVAVNASSSHAISFRRTGYCVVQGCVPTSGAIQDLHDRILDEFDQLLTAYKYQSDVLDLAQGFSNFRERGKLRFEMVVPWLKDHLAAGQSAWLPLVQELLGDDCRMMSCGVFLSLPGSEHQQYHTDGPQLSMQRDLPCHALNVFIPLVDVDKNNGTEIVAGTHSLGHPATGRVVPEVLAGNGFLFDYRVRHRGMANKTDAPRPVMYLTYARPWYTDVYNFSKERYPTVLRPAKMETRTRHHS